MTVQDPLIYRALASATLVVTTVFIILLATDRRGAWRRTPFGRSLMYLAVGIWLYALASTLRNWLGPDYLGRDTVRVIASGFVFLAMFSRTLILIRIRRGDRARD